MNNLYSKLLMKNTKIEKLYKLGEQLEKEIEELDKKEYLKKKSKEILDMMIEIDDDGNDTDELCLYLDNYISIN